ncbi:hypothetical protein Q428_03780 [Fervidicella metallireducens AeB]|uniref:Alpha-ribazole phosphatase n=1 Tax=Fervidicella metallireducens AeB TaxID=1403537 RepID=A0A017RZ87_9CLOT|nr:alpha-ribazole phosphatase [Fervidicella metallireducens]EYE89255.1 hypothetical protein Q428_03780 [Fervidicella metallireducens AeB]
MEIVFIRHGRTEINKKGCYLGAIDDELSFEGKNEIKNLNNYLKEIEFDAVYVSPLKRAKQTIELLEKSYSIDERLREINFGIFDGLHYREIEKKYPIEYSWWTRDYINYKIPEGESLSELFGRVEDFIKDVSYKHKRVLAVTHGGVIRCAMSLVFGSKEHFYKFQVNHGTVNIISVDNGYMYIKALNSFGNLSEVLV